MSTARKMFQPRAMLIVVTLLLTVKASSGGCECKTSSSNGSVTTTVTPPPNPQINITNLYGVTVGYEIWTGTSLEYKDGTVYGNSLSRAVAVTPINNGGGATQNNVATITYDTSFIIVVGVLDGGNYVYITNRVVNNYTSTRTFTIQASGSVN